MRGRWGRTFLRVIAWLLAVSPASGDVAERTDLAPQRARWQTYPRDIQSVVFDRSNRAWFLVNGIVPTAQIKRDVEQARQLRVPWLPSGRVMLFDSAGRIWLCTPDNFALGYDPAAGTWIERPGMPTPGHALPTISHFLCGPGVEDAKGRIYIADMSGCHVFDHGTWTYQSFCDADAEYTGTRPALALDDRGRVYGWIASNGGPGGTPGFWLHDDSGWRLVSGPQDPQLKGTWISSVIPLPGDRAVVCPPHGPAAIVKLPGEPPAQGQTELQRDIQLLSDSDNQVRRHAQTRIIERGPAVLPAVKSALSTTASPEGRARLGQIIDLLQADAGKGGVNGYALGGVRAWGRDPQGNVYVSASAAVTPEGSKLAYSHWTISSAGRVTLTPKPIADWTPSSILPDGSGGLFLQHYIHGLAHFQNGKLTRLTEDSDPGTEGLLGRDRGGRIYIKMLNGSVRGLDLNAVDVRRALAVTAYPQPQGTRAVCQDTAGRIVAKLEGMTHPFLSVWENGVWKDLPVPGGGEAVRDFISLRALPKGAILAPEKWSERVFYFDGKTWSVHPTMRDLVERRGDQLVSLLDPRGFRGEPGIVLRVDARKNIWCLSYDHVDVRVGNRWLTWTGFQPPAYRPIAYCLPVFGGELMFLGNGSQGVMARVKDGAVRVIDYPALSAGQLPSFDMQLDVQVDAGGRVLVRKSDDAAYILDGEHLTTVEDTGRPRFQDSSGRLWFVNSAKRQFVLLGPATARVKWVEPEISAETTVVEDRTGSYWINTQRGLLHLRQRAAGKAPEPEGTYFERSVPHTSCAGMWVDHARHLWLASGAGRLYRIQLPAE